MRDNERRILAVYGHGYTGASSMIRRMLWILCECGIPVYLEHSKILCDATAASIPDDMPRYVLDVVYWRERALGSELALESLRESIG